MIVGRSGEIRRLDQVLADVADGAGGTLLVVAAPGYGVTSLLTTAARRAARHARVVTARGVSGTVRGGLARDLARALDAGAADAESILDALARACTPGPLVLVVDDLHVADPQSQELVVEVIDRALGLGLRLAVIAGARSRPEPIPARFTSWPRLELGPLDLESSLAVLRSVGPIDEDAACDLAGRLRGNPTALRTVPSLLDADVRAGRRPVPARIPVPDPISLPWLAVLPADDEARAALLQAALCQPAPLAAGPAALPPRSVAALARFPWIDDELRWDDPWLPDVITSTASHADTCAAHRALAEGAVAAGLLPSVVVVHLDLAASGVDDGIADELHEQALLAESLGLSDVVPRAWTAAARHTGPVDRRTERAVRGGRALLRSGFGVTARDVLVELLARVPLQPEAAMVLDELRTAQRATLDPSVSVSALRQAADRARVDDPDLVPSLLWELSTLACGQGSTEVGVAAAREFRALESVGAPGTGLPWTGTALLAAALFQHGGVRESQVLRREAGAAADTIEASSADTAALLDAVVLDDLLLDLRPSASHRLLTLVQRLGGEASTVACLWGIQGWRARARGDLTTARRMLAEGLRLALDSKAVEATCGLRALAVEIASIEGDDDGLRREGESLRRLGTELGDRRRLATLDRALGLRALSAGQLDDAVVHLAASADQPMLGRGLRDGILPSRVDLVEAHVRAEDHEAARRRAVDVCAVLDVMDDPLARALSLRVQGLVSDDVDDGLALLGAALDAHTLADDPFEHARTHLLRGERLRRARRRGDARRELGEAARMFGAAGAVPWVARAESELRAAGGTASGSAAPGRPGGRGANGRPGVVGCGPDVDGLTPQELAVATAVAAGASNREVAEHLFLSPRTVEYHLGNVYRKLGVHGRGALGVRLLVDDGDA